MMNAPNHSLAEESSPLSSREFDQIRRFAYEKFGLDLRRGKEQLVAARLGKKLRTLRFRSFKEYYRHVIEDPTGEALIEMIDALTTNHTAFLRETAHFDFLRDCLLPEWRGRGPIEVWSAACSTGEEPYSIAFTLIAELGSPAFGSIHILATDISTRALATAVQAVYPAARFENFPEAWQRQFFLRGEGQWAGWRRVKPAVRKLVEFRRLNLVEPLPQGRLFPLIFCRNVMIYFDKVTRESLVNRLAACLEPGGYLFIGHAESLTGINHPLQYVRPAIYRKARLEPRRTWPREDL